MCLLYRRVVMEQPDDLQPEDLSTSSISTVIDLTRKGEECVLNEAPRDARRGAKSSGWYQTPSTSSPGLTFSESGSSDVPIQSGAHVQPDDAFSHTTVTLSYVSRSHLYSTQDALCGRSPLCGVPSISKFSLRPPCDSDGGLGETDRSLNQHYPEQAEGPVDLCQAGPEDDGAARRPREPREANGGVISCDGDVEKQVQSEEDRKHSRSWENNRGLENGGCDSQSSLVGCAESSPEALTLAAVEDEDEGSPEVVFLMSTKQDLCSLSSEYISTLEDPVSPSATSLDDVDDVFILPQASSSPSGDNLYLETEEEDGWDSRRTVGAAQQSSGVCDNGTMWDSSSESKLHHHRRKAALEPLIDLTDDICPSDVLEDKTKTVIAHMNGSTKALQRTLKAKELPLRSSRGAQLDAIVMNINSSRYKVSGCIRSSKNASASLSAASDSKLVNPKRNSTAKRGGCARTSVSSKTASQKAGSPVKRDKTNNIDTDRCKVSTSDSEILSNSKTSRNSTPPKSPRLGAHRKSRREPEDASRLVHSPETNTTRAKRRCSSQSRPRSAINKDPETEPQLLSQPDPSVEVHLGRCSSPSLPSSPLSKSPKKSPGKAKGKAAGGKTSPTAKMKGPRTPRGRRKKAKGGQSLSMFSPKEPEIKLKYVNYKEEKREVRSDSFSPFVHVERRQSLPSLCTVVNYPEEVRTQHRKGQAQQQALSTDFISAAIPSTSCLQLGRASTQGQHQRALVCCLCGQSANAMDLGDLHGPYYPEGYQPSTKTPASLSGLKEDPDSSDSDSSSCSIRGRRRKCAAPPAPWSSRSGAKQKGLLGSQRWTGSSGSPAAKRARSDASCADVEDWYSPPVLPLEPCEYWLHEDCGIWAAGVFLVKGKVYGLEEAAKVAQETTCSACCDPGAMLGCFFKGCPNKYHYRCALESDCVLIEENFSMKCKKHKNKTFRGPPGNRRDDR